jgi:hypothetical protein
VASELELLAARKQLLVTRASLQRLQAGSEAAALRDRFRLPDSIGSVVRDPQMRSLAIAAALFAVRRPRFASVVLFAGIAFIVARLFRRGRS